MARHFQLAMGLLLLVSPFVGARDPFVGASDPFAPQVCDETIGCVGPGACAPGVFCQASLCDPALACKGSLVAEYKCGLNETTVGETCQRRVELGASVGRSVGAPVAGDMRPVPVGAGVVLSDGNLTGQNLPNAWLSHTAYASAPIAGETSVTVYRSVISVDGSHDDVDTFLFPDADHTFSEFGVTVRHSDSVVGNADLTLGLVLLDLYPEGCFTRSSSGFGPNYECPTIRGLA